MMWLDIAAAVALIALALVVVVRRRRTSADQRTILDVDPLFATGIAITGAGAALATTLGGVMYGVMAAGLIVMAVGAGRTRHPHH